MAMSTASVDVGGVLQPQYGDLVVQPLHDESVAYTVSQLVSISAHDFIIPQVTADPTAAWTAEGADLTESDSTLDYLKVTPAKLTGLTIISNELASDSNPAAASIVGRGLARDFVKKVDAAFFGDTTTNGPSGLLSLTTQTVDDGGSITNLDVFAEAISKAGEKGAQVGWFVTDPDTALTLAKLKIGADYNQPLLGVDATNATERRILGVPLLVSAQCGTGDIWALPTDFNYVVEREGATLETDRSVKFTSDQLAVRAIMRVGFGFAYPDAIVRIYNASA